MFLQSAVEKVRAVSFTDECSIRSPRGRERNKAGLYIVKRKRNKSQRRYEGERRDKIRCAREAMFPSSLSRKTAESSGGGRRGGGGPRGDGGGRRGGGGGRTGGGGRGGGGRGGLRRGAGGRACQKKVVVVDAGVVGEGEKSFSLFLILGCCLSVNRPSLGHFSQ